MSTPRLAFGSVGLLGVVLFVACSGHEVPSSSSFVEELSARYPGAAALLAEAGRAPAVVSSDEIILRSRARASGRWIAATRTVELRVASDGAMTVGEPGGPEVRVRRSPSFEGSTVTVEHGTAVVREGERRAALLFPRAHGIEELVELADANRELSYDLGLPPGWSLAGGGAGAVAIKDERGATALSMVAREAWDTAGRALPVTAVIDGNRVRLALPAHATGPVLVDPEWHAGSALPVTRARSTTTLLPSGRVLIAGGSPNVGAVGSATAELYDPVSLVSTPTGSMTVARTDHAAVALSDGKVLIVGGADQGGLPLDSAEIYDPVAGTFTATGSMEWTRAALTATRLANGEVLVAGGTRVPLREDGGEPLSGATPEIERYDPETGTFSLAGTFLDSRADHSATPLPDGRILFAGGTDYERKVMASAEIYDPATEVSAPAGPLGAARRGHAAILLPNGKVLVAGGVAGDALPYTGLDSAELYDPQANTFTTLPTPMNEARAYAAAALLPDGSVMLVGGEKAAQELGINPPVASAERFLTDAVGGAFSTPPPPPSPESVYRPTLTVLPTGDLLLTGRTAPAVFVAALQVASATGSMTVARSFHTATLLPDGGVLVTGGDDIVSIHETAEIYRSATGAFESIPNLIHPRSAHSATTLYDGRVLILGGISNVTATILPGQTELFDPASAPKFVGGPPIITRRLQHTATLLADGRVLVVGGVDTSIEGLSDAEVFVPERGFVAVGSLAQARVFHSATRLSTGKVLVAGGVVSPFNNNPFGSTELYDPVTDTFAPGPDLPNPRARHTATTLPDGRVLFAGGAATGSIDIYDPEANAFSTIPGVPDGLFARFAASATLLPSGRVLLAGGGYSTMPPFSSFELFDPLGGTLVPASAGSLAGPRLGHTATLLANGAVLLLGGQDTFSPSHVTETADVVTDAAPLAAQAAPVLGPAPGLATPGASAPLAGSALVAELEGSGGKHSSPANFPLALWVPLDGAPAVGAVAPWSATSATWTPPAVAHPGPGLLFAVRNGVRSVGIAMAIAPAPDGMPCAADATCASGLCSGDGVCCDEVCDGVCRACTAAKKGSGVDGACGDIALATDPDDECTSLPECPEATGSCTGEGSCGACPATVCQDDHTRLVDGVTQDCSPYRCQLNECLTGCTSKLDCVGGFSCTAEGECASPPVDERPADCDAGGGRRSSDGPGPAAFVAGLALFAAGRRAVRRAAVARHTGRSTRSQRRSQSKASP